MLLDAHCALSVARSPVARRSRSGAHFHADLETFYTEFAMQWWPGVVDDPVVQADNDIKRGEEGQIVYNVNYEGFDEFAPERCEVSFLNQRAYIPQLMHAHTGPAQLQGRR